MPTDPLTLGQQLVAVLEGGHRTATYKLAVMVALLDLAVESVPDDPGARCQSISTTSPSG